MSLAELLVTPLGWMLRGTRSDPALSVGLAPELQPVELGSELTVVSSAFGPGDVIPKANCGTGIGENRSPALEWSAPPDGTRRLLLIVEDTDAPLRRPVIHTVALFDPDDGPLVQGALTPGNLRVQYVPAFRHRVGYHGPRPLPGHGLHHYGFHLYALDIEPDARTTASLTDLLEQVAGHVLAVGVLIGTRRA